MPEKSLYRPSPRALLTQMGDGSAVLLHLDTKFYYTLNPTALAIWKQISDHKPGRSLDDITTALTAEFAVSENDARRQAGDLLTELRDERLILVDSS